MPDQAAVGERDALQVTEAREHVTRVLGASLTVENGSLVLRNGRPVPEQRTTPAAIKRALDLVGSALALVVLSPLLLAVTIATLIDSGSPVLFRQPRVGRDGRVFDLLKFRTMVPGAEERADELMHLNVAGGMLKIHDDPRCTRVGGWIRRWYIDELPQLINVIRGEMSFVGPRPMPPYMDRNIPRTLTARLEVRPGLTGPWQLLPPPRVPLEQMAVIDCAYASEWSLFKDLKIILRTVPYTLKGSGI